MKKIKLDIDEMAAAFLRHFFTQVQQSALLKGFEVEHLVILHWSTKNYMKIQFESKYKLGLLPFEAISLRRLIFNLGLSDPMAAITRDDLCSQIAKQLPKNQPRATLS